MRNVTTLAGDVRLNSASATGRRPGRTDGPQDGIGEEARFYYPQGIAISTDDSTLFVVEDKCKAHCGTHNGHFYPTTAQYPEGWGNRVRMIDVATRSVTTLAGSAAEGSVDGVGTDAQFDELRDIAFADGAVYVTDRGNKRIRKIDVATRVVTTLTGLGDNSQVDGSVTTTTFTALGGITATSNGMRILVVDKYSIRQILPLGSSVSFPPLLPPLPAPPPPPPWVNTFIPGYSRDHVIGSKGGNAQTGYGFAFVKTGGYVTRVGPDNGIDVPYWEGPTDGGYSAVYTNRAGWIAVKDNGEIFCWGATQFGISGMCPTAACLAPKCVSAGVAAYYPKRIKFIYSGTASWCILYEDTTVYCWRNGGAGEPDPPGGGWLTANAGASGFAFLNRDGSIWSGGAQTCRACNGYPTEGNWAAIYALGTDNGFAALSTTGQIYTWGYAHGGMGSGYQYEYGNVRHPQGYTTIQPGYTSWCALWIDGTIECVGYILGNLGAWGSGIQPAEGGFVALYGNQYAYVAVHADGRAYAWGRGGNGGDQPEEGLFNVARVFSNAAAFVALHTDGSLTCWGRREQGGRGTAGATVNATYCPSGTGYTHVYSSYYGFAVINSAGAIITWGHQGSGSRTASGIMTYTQRTHTSTDFGYMCLHMQKEGFVARKTNGQLVSFGRKADYRAGGTSYGYFPEARNDRNFCHHINNRPACVLSEADKNETGWLFNGSIPFSEHAQDSPCGGGGFRGDPWAFLLPSPPPAPAPASPPPALPFPLAPGMVASPPPSLAKPEATNSTQLTPISMRSMFPRSPLSSAILSAITVAVGASVAVSAMDASTPTLGPLMPLFAVLQRISLNDAVADRQSAFAMDVRMDLAWAAGILDMGMSLPAASGDACGSWDRIAAFVVDMLNTVSLYVLAMVVVRAHESPLADPLHARVHARLTRFILRPPSTLCAQALFLHLMYLLRMYLRVGRERLGQSELKLEGKVSPGSWFRGPVTFSAVNIWPVPEVIITLFFSNGLVSTSVKVLSAALAREGCCIPFACWLPIVILLYLLVFYLWAARTLSKFMRQHAQLAFVPFSPEHMDDVLDPFLRLYNRLRTRCCRSTRKLPFVHPFAGVFLVGMKGDAEPERTRRISVNPFRFAALASSSTTTQDSIGGARKRVSPSPEAPSSLPSPPPSPPSASTPAAPPALQQAMDATYSLYYVWLGDARRGRERYALVATLHTLLLVLVGSTCPLCTGNSINGPLVAILLMQLSGVAWYLLARPTADRVLGSIMVFTWIIEASATACYLATPSQLASGTTLGVAIPAAITSPALPPPYLPRPPDPPSPSTPPSPPQPPGCPPPPDSPPPSPPPPTPPPAPPPSPPPPSPPIPLPCFEGWEEYCNQNRQISNDSLQYVQDPSQYIDEASQYLNEFCRQSEQNCPKPRLFPTGDLAFGLQLCSLFSTYVMCLYISFRALIALFCCKRSLRERPTKERAPEPEQEPSSPHVASLKSAPVASAEILAEVAKEAEAKLTAMGLEFVTLDLAARIVNLTNKLEFEGSKSVGGPGSFKVSSPSLPRKLLAHTHARCALTRASTIGRTSNKLIRRAKKWPSR